MKFKLYLEKSSPYQIYCDMDGVLCDFDGQFEKLGQGDPTGFEAKNGKSKFWKLIEEQSVKFWSEMPWLPGSKKMWDYIKQFDVYLLTTPAEFDDSRKGKIIWAKRELGLSPNKVIFEKDKFKYAKSNRILIDDFYDKKLKPWMDHGGIGVHFTDANKAIIELKNIIEGNG